LFYCCFIDVTFPQEKLGIFGFLCDLDTMVINAVIKILDAIGIRISDLIDLINELIARIFGPLVSLPFPVDIVPDLSILDGELNIAESLTPMFQVSFDVLRTKLSGVDLIQSAFVASSTGTPAFILPGVGDLELLYATGSTETVSVACSNSDQQFPYVFKAIATDRCGSNDFTDIVEVPCGVEQSSCAIDVTTFGDLPSCDPLPSGGNSNSFLFDLITNGSSVLYVCLTSDQFSNLDSLPTLVDFDVTDFANVLVTNPDTTPYQIPNYVSGLFEGDDTVTLDMTSLFQPDFDVQSGLVCPGDLAPLLAGIHWGHTVYHPVIFPVDIPPAFTLDFAFRGNDLFLQGEYFCMVPGRDVFEDPRIRVDFHVAFQAFSGFRGSDWVRSSSASYRCQVPTLAQEATNQCFDTPTCFIDTPGTTNSQCTDYVFFEREPTTENLTLTCPVDTVVRVIEVLSQYEMLEMLVDETLKFQNLCAGLSTCTFQGDQALQDSLCEGIGIDCPDNSSNSIFPSAIRGRHFKVYRAQYECLDYCDDSNILLPDPASGECVACGLGRYRNATMEQCEPCLAGSYSDVPRASACQPCPAGSYSERSGAGSCTPCVAGTAGAGSEDTCSPCPRDTAATADGAACVPCDAGFVSDPGSIECLPTPAGSFNDGLGGGQKPCPPGTFSSLRGATECRRCPPGSYARDFGSLQCLLCAPTTYADTSNRTTCSICPNGTATYTFGAVSMAECVPIPAPIQYSAVALDSLTCRDLLELDLLASLSLGDVEREIVLQQRLNQVGGRLRHKMCKCQSCV
jgi:hypothetical protein